MVDEVRTLGFGNLKLARGSGSTVGSMTIPVLTNSKAISQGEALVLNVGPTATEPRKAKRTTWDTVNRKGKN